MKSNKIDDSRKSGWLAAVIVGVIIGVFHLFLASIYLDHPPQWDELYHMLAAESWREAGELRILDGEYIRAAFFTKLVALQSYICGPSLECARSFSLIVSVLLVFSVTVFACIMISLAVGMVAGFLLAVNPAVIEAAQMVRFYSLHSLVFFLFACVLFILLTRWRKIHFFASLSLIGLALLLLYFANHLQVTTQIGLLGIAMGSLLISFPGLFGWLRQQPGFLIALVACGVVVLVLVGLYFVDVYEKIERLRWTPGWAEGNEHAYFAYISFINDWHPVLWPLVGFFALLSITSWPRLSLYCLTTFLVCLVLLSISGVRAPRYIMFVLPFLFIPLAGGVIKAFGLVFGVVSDSLKDWFPSSQNKLRIRLFAPLVLGMATLGYIAIHPLVRASVRMLSQPGYEDTFGRYSFYSDWPAAADQLGLLAKDYPTIITSSGVKAAWYLGNYDFELNYSQVLETDTSSEFGLDKRTGRRVVSSTESIMKILQEHEAVLVIVEDRHANDRRQVSTEVVQLLDKVGSRVETQAQNLIIWVIQDSSTATPDITGGDLK